MMKNNFIAGLCLRFWSSPVGKWLEKVAQPPTNEVKELKELAANLRRLKKRVNHEKFVATTAPLELSKIHELVIEIYTVSVDFRKENTSVIKKTMTEVLEENSSIPDPWNNKDDEGFIPESSD